MTWWRDTSVSRVPRRVLFVPWWTAPPVIVAEALVAVPDPLLTALRAGPPATGTAVAAALARSLAPAEDSDPAPPWLFPEQQRSFRRMLAALRRHGGALLADPVGSGKTYVALAVAGAFNRGSSTACLVPATLLPQWESAAARVGIPVALVSHEQVSRGRLPEGTRGVAILDESHHFRNRHTRRYTHAAAWLVGRPALLVTATPIVNRLSDLSHQLRLATRDNALAVDGIASLTSLLASGCATPALGKLVIENEATVDARPRRVSKTSRATADECCRATDTVEKLSRLRLARNESVAALIRGVLLRAAGSSPAALAGALRRYRKLLLHARDAALAGRAMDRSELRRFTAELGDQLIWWELLPSDETSSDLELSDLHELESLVRSAAGEYESDTKLRRLRELLVDGKPTLIFTASRDTVRYIRERLSEFRLAWCTGECAGLGPTTLPRSAVLGWFQQKTGNDPAFARHLVVTDVAAEGLDLQRAARVVHYDLPWTAMRLEQREGRAVRLGSRHAQVEVVRFKSPPVLERSLRMEATLARKARLPAVAGLGSGGRHIWRWRAELAQRYSKGDAVAGTASVFSPERGLLAGFALYRSSDAKPCLSATVGWLGLEGGWTESPEIVSARLAQAEAQEQVVRVDHTLLRDWLTRLAPTIRERLVVTRGRHWVSSAPAPAARRIAARLNGLIREAARLRQPDRLLQLERALGFVAGGHTAGEAMQVERLADVSDADLVAALGQINAAQLAWDGIEVRLTGLIVFGPDGSTFQP